MPETAPELIRCRARVSGSCLDGRPTSAQMEGDYPMEEDGTFDGLTIVCDPCWVLLMPFTPSGKGLDDELPAAIARARREISA